VYVSYYYNHQLETQKKFFFSFFVKFINDEEFFFQYDQGWEVPATILGVFRPYMKGFFPASSTFLGGINFFFAEKGNLMMISLRIWWNCGPVDHLEWETHMNWMKMWEVVEKSKISIVYFFKVNSKKLKCWFFHRKFFLGGGINSGHNWSIPAYVRKILAISQPCFQEFF